MQLNSDLSYTKAMSCGIDSYFLCVASYRIGNQLYGGSAAGPCFVPISHGGGAEVSENWRAAGLLCV